MSCRRRFWVFVTMVGILVGGTKRARADGPATTLVLIIANNRGSELGRPELHYADDDGAKYRAMFHAAAATPGDVQLLARFDRDTTRLFSDAPDGLPTRAAVDQKILALAERRAALREQGRDVEFVLVYAGHGDIDRGRGFIQLEDGAFTADDLAAVVRRVDASRTHVILDSCNSLFLVSPRKPGGRRVATSQDAGRALRERMPGLGVLWLLHLPAGWCWLAWGAFSLPRSSVHTPGSVPNPFSPADPDSPRARARTPGRRRNPFTR